MKKRTLFGALSLAIGLAIVGCTALSESLGPSNGTHAGDHVVGRVSFAVQLPRADRSAAGLAEVIDHLDVSLTGANLASPMATTITHGQITGGTASASFDSVPAGPAVLSVSVEDAANNVLASGSANVAVVAGREATANLTLSVPTTGSVSSTITLVEATPTPTPTATPEPPQTATVTMTGMAFSPNSVEVAQGGTVTFINNDSMPHNVTPTGGAQFTGSGTLNQGNQVTITFNTVGTQHYLCTFHGGMTGTVIVR